MYILYILVSGNSDEFQSALDITSVCNLCENLRAVALTVRTELWTLCQFQEL